jgi:hypothetical protein
MGVPVALCVRALQECFEEYDASDKSKLDHLSIYLFSREGAASQQLYSVAYNEVELRHCPAAFVRVQEFAFATNVARFIESEHKCTKAALMRGFELASLHIVARECDPLRSSGHLISRMISTSTFAIGPTCNVYGRASLGTPRLRSAYMRCRLPHAAVGFINTTSMTTLEIRKTWRLW